MTMKATEKLAKLTDLDSGKSWTYGVSRNQTDGTYRVRSFADGWAETVLPSDVPGLPTARNIAITACVARGEAEAVSN
jgi:hypothetical protein